MTAEEDAVRRPDEECAAETAVGASSAPPSASRGRRVTHVLALGVLPAAAILLGGAAGGLKWAIDSHQVDVNAATDSVRAASDSTIAILSYQPDTVERDLDAARDRLTGDFRDSYTELTKDVVIPGAKEKQISAVAAVPVAASISVDGGRAEVLLFVNQTTVIGDEPPSNSASTVKVTVEMVDGRWLVSGFEPI